MAVAVITATLCSGYVVIAVYYGVRHTLFWGTRELLIGTCCVSASCVLFFAWFSVLVDYVTICSRRYSVAYILYAAQQCIIRVIADPDALHYEITAALRAVASFWIYFTILKTWLFGPAAFAKMWGWAYNLPVVVICVVAFSTLAVMSVFAIVDKPEDKFEASFSRYVAAVLKEDRKYGFDILRDAVTLIKERRAAHGTVNSSSRTHRYGLLYRSRLYTGSIQFEEYVASSKQFLEHLQRLIEKKVVHNAYPIAAATQLSGELKRVIMRGLGDVYDVTLPQEEMRFLAEIRCTIKHGRQTRLDNDVMYMCVSYKHQRYPDGLRILKRCTRSNYRVSCTCNDEYRGWKDMGMFDSDWRDIYREAKRCALMAGVKYISLWVDRQVYRGDYSWIALGLVPYLVVPTIRSRVTDTEADRLWLRLEQACAKIGPGITSDWRDYIDMLQHLVVTRTPVESFLAISELVRGRGCDRYLDPARTTFIEDLVRLRSWADGVVRAGSASVILQTPMEDLSWVKSGRRDCSHLAIYDDDLEDVHLVKDYKQALRAGETPGNVPWRVEDLLLDGRAVGVKKDCRKAQESNVSHPD